MRRISLIAGAALVAIALSGCAGPAGASYVSPSALHTAYTDAGGECDGPSEVPEAMVGEGAHALMCPDVTFLIVFDTDEQQNRYLASVLDGESSQAVVGERWAVISEDPSAFAGKLGGTVETG